MNRRRLNSYIVNFAKRMSVITDQIQFMAKTLILSFQVRKVHLEIQDASDELDQMVPRERTETLAIVGLVD